MARIRSTRSLRRLLDAEEGVLAEMRMDAVRADSLLDGNGQAVWTEMEAELAGLLSLLLQIRMVIESNTAQTRRGRAYAAPSSGTS